MLDDHTQNSAKGGQGRVPQHQSRGNQARGASRSRQGKRKPWGSFVMIVWWRRIKIIEPKAAAADVITHGISTGEQRRRQVTEARGMQGD